MPLIQDHSEVSEALDMVLEELAEESRSIYSVGGRELSHGNVAPALQAIEYAKRLDKMSEAVKEIRKQWSDYLRDFEQVPEEVREILRWQRPTAERECGSRTVGEVSPWTALVVRFEDGTEIQEHTAKETFAKSIEKLGASRVANLEILMARQPLVARNRTGYDGPETSLAEIAGGWTVRTDCSTRQKARYLKGIAEALGESIEISIVQRSGAALPERDDPPVIPHGTVVLPRIFTGPGWQGVRDVPGIPADWKVSDVVKAWFPILFARGLVEDDEIEYLLTSDSSKIFKVGGRSVLLVNRGDDSDRFFPINDGTLHARFYDTTVADLRKGDRRFYLSSQFMPPAMGPLIRYLEEKGISRAEIIQEVEAFRNS